MNAARAVRPLAMHNQHKHHYRPPSPSLARCPPPFSCRRCYCRKHPARTVWGRTVRERRVPENGSSNILGSHGRRQGVCEFFSKFRAGLSSWLQRSERETCGLTGCCLGWPAFFLLFRYVTASCCPIYHRLFLALNGSHVNQHLSFYYAAYYCAVSTVM